MKFFRRTAGNTLFNYKKKFLEEPKAEKFKEKIRKNK